MKSKFVVAACKATIAMGLISPLGVVVGAAFEECDRPVAAFWSYFASMALTSGITFVVVGFLIAIILRRPKEDADGNQEDRGRKVDSVRYNHIQSRQG